MKTESLIEYIDGLMAERETTEVEFKSAKGGFPGSFWETYSAFANTNGGTIVLGVKEKDNCFSVDTLSDEKIHQYKKEFFDGQHNPNTISHPLIEREEDVIEGEYYGKKFLIFRIPRADRDARPVYRTRNPYGGTYRRNHEGDYLCSDKAVNQMLADKSTMIPADSRILTGYTLEEDIDIESLTQYRRLMATIHPSHPWITLETMDFLKKIGAYRIDRSSHKEGFTVAGVLMFGKTEAITDNECMPHYMVDYREIPDDDTTTRWIDRVYPDGTWEANLFQFYRRVMPKLEGFMPTPFRLQGNRRIDLTDAHVALREAFVNTCIHARYSSEAKIVICKFRNAIVFSNPGTLLVSIHQFYTGGESICRNPSLQKMFGLVGTAEKAGSGVDKILKGWREANWRLPFVTEKTQPDRVELYMPLESILSDEVKQALTEQLGDNILNIDHNRLVTLALAYIDGNITNQKLQYLLNLHKADITTMLKELCESKMLVSTGSGRGTHYRLSEKTCDLSDKVACNKKKVASSASANQPFANKVTRQRSQVSALMKTIVQYCVTWRSLNEISIGVGRTPEYLRRKIIPRMVTEKMLIQQYPESPRHPNQKYRANQL